MAWVTDPTIWIGLLTLIVLEIVLGVDNLVFIAILADKLPPAQRDRARLIGLGLALLMRLVLLSVMSWLVTLTTPLFSLWRLSFSGRDLILLVGGLFLLFKATSELHERLEGIEHSSNGQRAWASFGVVVAQIVLLDAVFSLDSVITAVGMVDHLGVMMAAVVIAMGVMVLASKPLTAFVNAHPTVVVLCLSFLLMIGLSLLAEGLGFHLPKGYLYAAIGFSIMIEFFNQWAKRNLLRNQARIPLRERTANSILRMLGGRSDQNHAPQEQGKALELPAFGQQERHMVSGVLSLAERSVQSVMTPRADIEWLDLAEDPQALRAQLVQANHGLFPVAHGELDRIAGIARARDLLADLLAHGKIDPTNTMRQPLVVPASVNVVKLVEQMRSSRAPMALVSDEFGSILGLVTPIDLLEAIAGEFPEEGELPEIQPQADAGHWLVDGLADLHALEAATDVHSLAGNDDYSTLAGFLLDRLEQLPREGEVLEVEGLRFEVLRMDKHRIALVDVRRTTAPAL
ncbi:TerC family protein [Acidovorax sp. HDW3]|uniref:TerC family protein n=1 Tax=Acidovorax sp. HDW3 TaxID=2714923 RepID=UPI00140BBEEF|nr:TerC family protein [Acidovorax sp. HDW3]QIL45476.1 TerC family protein [Acidovorax sp. HDW3]